MLWLQVLLNALGYGVKILTLMFIWVFIENCYEVFLIRTVCRVLNVTSRLGRVMIRYMMYISTYLSCLIIMIFAYSLVAHIDLVETRRQILYGVEIWQPEKNDEKKLEWMLLMIISRHLVRLKLASYHGAGMETLKFVKRFSLIGFMLEGYLFGFWKITYSACFLVDFVELMKLLCRVFRAVDEGTGYRHRDLFKTSLTCLGLCWAYIFVYHLPSLFIRNVFYFEGSKEIGVISLFLFRINFFALVILSATDFPFKLSYPYVGLDTVDEIVNLSKRPPRSPIVVPLFNLFNFSRGEFFEKVARKRGPDTYHSIPGTNLEGKLGSGKMKQRATVGQLIRCMVGLKRKVKQIRAKKEKWTHSTRKGNELNEGKD